MNLLEALVMGAIQGLGEFIPISSSAHLVVVPKIFHWHTPGLAFDVALHLGTLVALAAYFWREWYDLIRGAIAKTRFGRNIVVSKTAAAESYLLWPIILGCLPAAIAGYEFESVIEHALRSPKVIAATMILLGLLLFAADRIGKKTRPMERITARDWIIMGCAQALALIPGVSRSGITITAGLFCGLRREAAARFSFLLGSPIILGAAIFEMKDILESGLPASQIAPFAVGILSAGVVGYLCIGFLLNYLKRKSMDIFVGYRIAFGLLMILLISLGRI